VFLAGSPKTEVIRPMNQIVGLLMEAACGGGRACQGGVLPQQVPTLLTAQKVNSFASASADSTGKRTAGKVADSPVDVKPAPQPELTQIVVEKAAGNKNGALGFYTLPPGKVFLLAVSRDSWADRAGLSVGDEIVALDGQSVETMSHSLFSQTLRRRPLHLEVLRAEASGARPKHRAGNRQKLAIGTPPLIVREGSRIEELIAK